jgi:indole-3-glycerol phosphate synthase
MNILEEIIQSKYTEVAARKLHTSAADLEKMPLFGRETISLKESLLASKHYGIIAEFKRKSPSKGQFIGQQTVEEITQGYVKAGAAGLSVLTDEHYFGGTLADLVAARKVNQAPLLRKDFMVDEYQILEAKANGADVILLIAAGIDSKLLNRLAKFAKSLNLETLLEVREKEELDGNLSEYIDVVGVNNRNLKDFKVDINISIETSEYIPSQFVKISESGISTPEVIHQLSAHGFKGFLMGEAFMQTADPLASIQTFINKL